MELPPAPLELIVEVVNGWSAVVRRGAGSGDETYPELMRLLHTHHLDAPDVNDHELSDVADRLHPIFALPTPDERLAALRDAVTDLRPVPLPSMHGPVWSVDERRGLECALLFGLADHARTDPTLQRLGTCDAHRCIDVFVDLTQARTRRYCAPGCQNRAKAAAFRRRHTASTPLPSKS